MITKTEKSVITVNATVKAHIKKVWDLWTNPQHIVHWNNATGDWYTPRAENDFLVGGKFIFRMAARDGSMSFDFSGVYDKIDTFGRIEYTLDDGRKVQVMFIHEGEKTVVSEKFEAEQENSLEMQEAGWQNILNNFKKYVEKSDRLEPMHFEIGINAPVERVYKTMIDEKTYHEWTTLFNPSSHFVGSWKKGEKIVFLGADENGKTSGMFSIIKENIQNKFISIEHQGIIKDEKEITSGKEAESWAGSLENYTFIEQEGKTLLSIDVDTTGEFKTFFNETWPNSLNKLKDICEK